MVNYEVVLAEEKHIGPIAYNMRAADRKELFLASRSLPGEALRLGYLYSDLCFTTLVDGEPGFMFGVIVTSLIERQGVVWMLGTDRINDITFTRREFAKMRAHVYEMMEGLSSVHNFVHAENEVAIKWLRFLGFDIDDEPQPHGVFGAPFYRFEMRTRADV